MNIAVLFAGGVGSRMHSKDVPKQFLVIHGKPILVHTIEVFQNNPEIDAIVIACNADYLAYCQELVERYNLTKVAKIVPGGETGQLSIYAGLCATEEVAGADNAQDTIVLIHDGVRPLINSETISANIASVKEYGSAITAVKVKETVLVVDENEIIQSVPSRADSRLARAPQSFWLSDILAAHRDALAAGRTNYIDSASMLMERGMKLHLVEGPDENIKVTTPDDFFSMRAILDAREND